MIFARFSPLAIREMIPTRQNGAETADPGGQISFEGHPSEFIETLPGSCHDLQKTSCSGCTFIIHGKIGNLAAVIQQDALLSCRRYQ